MCTSRSTRSGDTSYIGPCTDVNVDGNPKLQDYQDTYITCCTKLAEERPLQSHILTSTQNLSLCMSSASFK